MKQIVNQRRVVVSVKQQSIRGKEVFRILGVGAVSAPLYHCLETMKKFESLKQVSSVFHIVKHRSKKQQIYLVLKAMGYEARLLLEYKFKGGSPMEDKMDWKVVWGSFKGMVGHFQFRTLSPRQTEISMWAQFSGKDLPFPPFFLKFTLEVIAEKVAQKMRVYLEDSYKKSQKLRR